MFSCFLIISPVAEIFFLVVAGEFDLAECLAGGSLPYTHAIF